MPQRAPNRPPPGRASFIPVAFVACCTSGSPTLELGRECAEIQTQLLHAPPGPDIRVTVSWAARVDDLQCVLLRARPTILHLSTHGLPGRTTGEPSRLQTRGRFGECVDIPPHAFDDLVAGFCEHVRLVVLNACHSEMLAQMLARRVDCAIGMAGEITDEAAIVFSAGLYRALAYGESLERAFALACNAIELAGLGQGAVPQMFTRRPAFKRLRLVPQR